MYQLYFKFLNRTFLVETNSLNILNILKLELWPSKSINYVKKCKIIYVGANFSFDKLYDNYVETLGSQYILGFDKKENCKCLFVNQSSTIQPIRNFITSIVSDYNKENTNFLVLHASCVSKNNQGFLLLGKKHSGKTTLSLEMVSNYEYNLITDDLSFITMRGKKIFCHSLFKGIHLNDETFDYYQGYFSNIYNKDSNKTRYYIKKTKQRSLITDIVLSHVVENMFEPYLEKLEIKYEKKIIVDNYVNFSDENQTLIEKKINDLFQKNIKISNCKFGTNIYNSGVFLNNLINNKS